MLPPPFMLHSNLPGELVWDLRSPLLPGGFVSQGKALPYVGWPSVSSEKPVMFFVLFFAFDSLPLCQAFIEAALSTDSLLSLKLCPL